MKTTIALALAVGLAGCGLPVGYYVPVGDPQQQMLDFGSTQQEMLNWNAQEWDRTQDWVIQQQRDFQENAADFLEACCR